MKTRELVKTTVLLMFASILLQANKKPQYKTPKAVQGTSTALQITQDEFNTLSSAYELANPTGTWGGMMGKQDIVDLINSIPSGEDNVKMHFCTDAGYMKTALMLKGDKTWYQGQSHIQYRRNGGSPDAFCPAMCNRQNSSNVTLTLNGTQYDTLANDFNMNHMGATLGGNFNKDALMAICNSLNMETSTVSFRFCTDPSGNTSVIFIGGSENQPTGATLYYRNGGTDEAFCPTFCD